MKNIFVKLTLLLPLVSGLAYAQQTVSEKDRTMQPALMSKKALSSFLIGADTQQDLTIVVGERGHILYKSVGEESWQQAQVPVRVNLTSVSMTQNHGYWAIGHDAIILKAQSADKWEITHKGNYLATVAKQEIQGQLKALEAADDPDLDLLDSLEYMQDELEYSQKDGGGSSLFDIHMQENGLGLIVGASGSAFMTRNYGKDWHFISAKLNNPDLLHLYSTSATPDGTMFIAGEAGLIFRSNNGEQWEQLDIPYYGTILNVHASGTDEEVFLLGMSGKLLHSTDNGQQWHQLQLPSKTILQGACTTQNGALLLTGLGGQVFFVQNGKATTIPFSGRQHLSAAICTNNNYQVAGEGGIHPLDLSSISVDAN